MARNLITTTLYNSVKQLINNAKSKIVRNVNATMVLTYYAIGKVIVDDEQNGKYRAEYAKQVLSQLSIQLSKEFGKGFCNGITVETQQLQLHRRALHLQQWEGHNQY